MVFHKTNYSFGCRRSMKRNVSNVSGLYTFDITKKRKSLVIVWCLIGGRAYMCVSVFVARLCIAAPGSD